MRPIDPIRVDVDSVSRHQKHLWVRMLPEQSIQEFLDEPSLWRKIQANHDKRVRPGDVVTLVTDEGGIIYERLPCLRAVSGDVFLGAPLRVIRLETNTALFEDELHRVVPVGLGYSVQLKRGNVTESMVYESEAIAKHEILRP